MATKLYDCMVATSEYNDRNGNKKRHWENVGAIWQDTDSNGNSYSYLMLKRIFNPAGLDTREGADAVRISLFKPQPKEQQGQPIQNQNQGQQQQNNWAQSSQPFGNNNQQNGFGQPINDMPF